MNLGKFFEIPGIQLEKGGAIFAANAPPSDTTAPDGTPYPGGSLCILNQGGLFQLQDGVWVELLGGDGADQTGEAILDFGNFPGQSSTSVSVAVPITGEKLPTAFFMADTTSDHSVSDHRYAAIFIGLVCEVAEDSLSFAIHGVSQQQMQGTFKVRWRL